MTLPTPYAEGRDWVLYHGDCLDILPRLDAGGVDAVVTDPPYGIGLRTDFASRGCGSICEANDYPPVHGDDQPFDPSPFLNFSRVALFGANYYADRLPPSGKWLVWYKRRSCHIDQADAELCWTTGAPGSVPRVIQHEWMGMIKDSERGVRRVHPTQKPIDVMTWVLDQMDVSTFERVLDPFTGSGTTGVACIRTGRKFIGIEIDGHYCEVAAKRMRQAEADQALFTQDEPKPKQMTLEGAT